MHYLSKLFQLIQLTRSQPQYGYALSGIKQDDLSNLAEHHYLVTFIAWQLALLAKRAGLGKLLPEDKRLAASKLPEKLEKIKDQTTKQVLGSFIKEWAEGLESNEGTDHILAS